MLKVGLIGVGGISSAHIPAWDAMPDAELVALCDVRPEQMKDYESTKHCYTDAVEMLDKEQLDKLRHHTNTVNKDIHYFVCANNKIDYRGDCPGRHYVRADAVEQVVMLELRRIVRAVNSGTDDLFGVFDAFPDFGGDYGYRFIIKPILIFCMQRHCFFEGAVFVHTLNGITCPHGTDVFINLVFYIMLFEDEERHSGGNIVFLHRLVDTENIRLFQIGEVPLHCGFLHRLHNNCVQPWLVIMKKPVEIFIVLFSKVKSNILLKIIPFQRCRFHTV